MNSAAPISSPPGPHSCRSERHEAFANAEPDSFSARPDAEFFEHGGEMVFDRVRGNAEVRVSQLSVGDTDRLPDGLSPIHGVQHAVRHVGTGNEDTAAHVASDRHAVASP